MNALAFTLLGAFCICGVDATRSRAREPLTDEAERLKATLQDELRRSSHLEEQLSQTTVKEQTAKGEFLAQEEQVDDLKHQVARIQQVNGEAVDELELDQRHEMQAAKKNDQLKSKLSLAQHRNGEIMDELALASHDVERNAAQRKSAEAKAEELDQELSAEKAKVLALEQHVAELEKAKSLWKRAAEAARQVMRTKAAPVAKKPKHHAHLEVKREIIARLPPAAVVNDPEDYQESADGADTRLDRDVADLMELEHQSS